MTKETYIEGMRLNTKMISKRPILFTEEGRRDYDAAYKGGAALPSHVELRKDKRGKLMRALNSFGEDYNIKAIPLSFVLIQTIDWTQDPDVVGAAYRYLANFDLEEIDDALASAFSENYPQDIPAAQKRVRYLLGYSSEDADY